MGAPTATSSLRSPWLIGFGLVAVAQLAFVALGLPAAVFVTWLLAPSLAVWVWRAYGPKLLILALLFCWAGDVLGNPALIGVGRIGVFLSVAAFAVAEVVLIVLFVRRGALASQRAAIGGHRRWRAAVALFYVVLAAMGLVSTWSNLDSTLRVVAVAYLFLLVAMGTAAFMLDILAGIGGALFFGSHLLVVLEVGGRIDGTGTMYRLAGLALYLLGILLIAIGVVSGDLRTKPRLDDGTKPAQLAA